MTDWTRERVIVTGGAGFLGRAVVGVLAARGVAPERVFVPRSRAFDLRTPDGCRAMFRAFAGATRVIHCAGTVGGLGLNRSHPARMFHDNLAMSLHLLEAARDAGLLGPSGLHFTQVGSMTSYPATAPLPFKEEDLWNGMPDAEIASYGLAKRAALQALDAHRVECGLRSAYVIPVNLYGPGDNTADPARSHVAGALVRKFVDAADRGGGGGGGEPEVVNWGTGAPTRDFLYIDDAAEGVVRAGEVIDDASPVNLSGGREVSIRELSDLIARLAGFRGRVVWDASKGDGMARRCLDGSRARTVLGWEPRVGLEEGFTRTVAWYRGVRGGGGPELRS